MTTSDGEQLKLDGFAQVLAAEVAVNRGDYTAIIHSELERLIAEGRPFTSEDLTRAVPEGVEPHSPNVIGAIVGSAAKRGVIVPLGYTSSRRPSRRAGRLMVWIAASCDVSE